MTNKDFIIRMVHENNGIITEEQVSSCGLSGGVLSTSQIKAFRSVHHVDYIFCPKPGRMKSSIGKYDFKKEFLKKPSLFPHGFTHRTPHKYHMTFVLFIKNM